MEGNFLGGFEMMLSQLQAQILFICNGSRPKKIMEIITALEERKLQRSYNYVCTQLRWLADHGLLIKRSINHGRRKTGYGLQGHPSYYTTNTRGMVLAEQWKDIINTKLRGGCGDRDSVSLKKYITKSRK